MKRHIDLVLERGVDGNRDGRCHAAAPPAPRALAVACALASALAGAPAAAQPAPQAALPGRPDARVDAPTLEARDFIGIKLAGLRTHPAPARTGCTVDLVVDVANRGLQHSPAHVEMQLTVDSGGPFGLQAVGVPRLAPGVTHPATVSRWLVPSSPLAPLRITATLQAKGRMTPWRTLEQRTFELRPDAPGRC